MKHMTRKQLLELYFKKLLLIGCNCLDSCIKSGENKKYCEYACKDYSEYFKCQSTCVKDDPHECIQNTKCRNKCDGDCKKHLPSI